MTTLPTSLKYQLYTIFLFITPFFLQAQETQKEVWSKLFLDMGTFSSPRPVELNGDGVMDVVIGAGKQEFFDCEDGVIALDGKTGKIIWTYPSHDQVFGSPHFMDINQDGTKDVIISGRSALLDVIDGKTGELIWEFTSERDSLKLRKMGYYNFYNPQFIPDMNDDGLDELLVANGGDVMAAPYDPDRPAGKLMILDAKSGNVLYEALTPDKKETYMSPVVYPFNGEDLEIILGTGGETVGGSLYRVKLSDLKRGNIKRSKKLIESTFKGFIAPPLLHDHNEDGVKDILVNAVDGRFLIFDGVTNKKLLEMKVPGTEAYSSIGIGHIKNQQKADYFLSFAEGVWPQLSANRQIVVDGTCGENIHEENAGIYQTSSGLTYDLDKDGYDEVLYCVNYGYNVKGRTMYFTTVRAFNMQTKKTWDLITPVAGSNVSSTPWIGDLDGNGKLDIVFSYMNNPFKIYNYSGLVIKRVETPYDINPEDLIWGSYMGSMYDGVR